VGKGTTRGVFGTAEALEENLKRSPASRHVNPAFVERQNNTMRQHNRRFTRKSLGFSKKRYWLERQLHLCVGYYHFCLPHGGLREEIEPPLPTKGNGSPKKWREVTPMMAIGVTDHVWTLQKLLTYRVSPCTSRKIKSTINGHQVELSPLLFGLGENSSVSSWPLRRIHVRPLTDAVCLTDKPLIHLPRRRRGDLRKVHCAFRGEDICPARFS